MASNLPPGITDSMLPGNTPEDIAFERLCEELQDYVPAEMSEKHFLRLAEWIADKLEKAESSGYNLGLQEANEHL